MYDSAARYGGVGLNDTLLPGPKLQQNVLDVLLRFLSNPVALGADGDVLTSYHGKARQTVPPIPVERTRPLETNEVYEAMRFMFGDRASPYLA